MIVVEKDAYRGLCQIRVAHVSHRGGMTRADGGT
jgi:hypothetical protein